MSKSLEGQIQIEVFNWIRANEEEHPVLKVVYHTPNSFFGTSFGVVMWLKKLGMRKGVYDIIVPISKQGYSSLWIEIKKGKGKLTPEQNMFSEIINQYSDNPTMFKVFYDADSCIQSIKSYLSI
jgi:hypothetical protein